MKKNLRKYVNRTGTEKLLASLISSTILTGFAVLKTFLKIIFNLIKTLI